MILGECKFNWGSSLIFLLSFDLTQRHSLTDIPKAKEIVYRVVGRRTPLAKLLHDVMMSKKKIMHSIKHWFTINVLLTMMTEFCYCGSKIRDIIRNLQQSHSSFCDIITIKLFKFSSLVPKWQLRWLSERKAPSFISENQQALGKSLCIWLQRENWVAVTNANIKYHS